MNNKFEKITVVCGGNDTWDFSAKYGEVWLYGEISLKQQRILGYFCEYPPSVYYNEEEEYYLFGEDALEYRKDPPEGYPTWREIVEAASDPSAELLADSSPREAIARILETTHHSLDEPCNRRFEHVKVTYTGGNVWVFSALYNGWTWLYGAVDQYITGHVHDCEEDNDDPACENEERDPAEGYPTWQEIIDAVKANCDEIVAIEVEEMIRDRNPDLTVRCSE